MKNFLKKEKRTIPLVLIVVIALFFAGVHIFLFAQNSTTEQQSTLPKVAETTENKLNTADLHIAQYSDRHITENAIDANGDFSTLALADFLNEDKNYHGLALPSSQVAGAGLALLQESPKKEYGTWIWTPLMDMTPTYVDSVLKGAKSAGINTIYVSIDSYLDVFVMPNGAKKEDAKKAFSEKLEKFVTQAQSLDIAVDAEAGWRNWAEDGNQYKAFAVINFAKEFNRTQKYTLRGFQYDVEPYLLASYKNDPVPVLQNFLTLIDESITLLGPKTTTHDLNLSIVIPDFYDKNQAMIPEFYYDKETSSAYDHLLDVLEKRPGSDVIVMSYRNFAIGSDGSIDISNGEVETATNGLYSTHVILAQETGDVLPPYITFNNTSKRYYSDQINEINKAFEPYANFGGIAVHYVNAFLILK